MSGAAVDIVAAEVAVNFLRTRFANKTSIFSSNEDIVFQLTPSKHTDQFNKHLCRDGHIDAFCEASSDCPV